MRKGIREMGKTTTRRSRILLPLNSRKVIGKSEASNRLLSISRSAIGNSSAHVTNGLLISSKISNGVLRKQQHRIALHRSHPSLSRIHGTSTRHETGPQSTVAGKNVADTRDIESPRTVSAHTFGQQHGFRVGRLPFLVVGGFPRFQYEGYWFSVVDPYPPSWSNSWYDTDDVYVAYLNGGYYLYNQR